MPQVVTAQMLITKPGHDLVPVRWHHANIAARIRCGTCQGLAGDPDNDAIMVVKISEFIGAYVYLCHTCYAIDISASHAN